jgi:poly(3-hydroxybutyrate) depolymerase
MRVTALLACFGNAVGSKTCSKSVPGDLTPGGQTVLRHFSQTDSDSRLGTYKRQYYVNLPKGYSGKEQLPVLVYFHGWCDDTTWIGKLAQVGDEQNYITVRPIGMEDGQEGCASWNSLSAGRLDVCDPKRADEYEYTSCKTTQQEGACNCYTCYDDVKFFSDLMTSLLSELCIDEDLVFASGSSNGGIFLYPLAAQLHERGLKPKLRAIAPFYGAAFRNMEDVPSSLAGTSVFAHHGTRDTEVPAEGGMSGDYYYYLPIDQTLADYASVNGCDNSQTAIQTAFDKRKHFTGCFEHLNCPGGARVVRCNFNEDHGFWEDYQEEMLWSFLGPLVAQTVNMTAAVAV